MTWLPERKQISGGPVVRQICSPRQKRTRAASRAENAVGRNSSGSGLSWSAAALDGDQIAAVEQPGDEGQEVAGEVLRAQLKAAAHEQRRPERRRAQARPPGARDGRLCASHKPQTAKAKLATLPNRVALPSLVMRMPTCQAARSAAKKKPRRSRIVTISARERPVRPAARDPRNHEQERQGQRQPPETGGDWSDSARRTSHGPNASAQLPSSRAGKARR